MSFDPQECWDCPITVLHFAVWIVVGLLAVTLFVWLVAGRRRAPPIVPALIGTFVVFCYLLGTLGVWKFRLLYVFPAWTPPDDFRSWRMSRAADMAILAGWYLVTAWTWFRVRRRSRAA